MIENFADILKNSILLGFWQVWVLLRPYAVQILIASLSVGMFKMIITKCTYDFSIISGESSRMAKKKARRMEKFVDFILSIKDIV